MSKMIVGIAGVKGAGKGEVARIFEDHGFVRMSFATVLKDVVAVLFNWERHLLEGDTEESRTFRETADPSWQQLCGCGVFSDCVEITPRLVLQRIGTDVVRNHIHHDFWIMTTLSKIREITARGKHVVIDDCRFINELQVCDVTVRVIRDTNYHDMHESETAHITHTFTHVIDNSGTLNDLRAAASELVRSLKD